MVPLPRQASPSLWLHRLVQPRLRERCLRSVARSLLVRLRLRSVWWPPSAQQAFLAQPGAPGQLDSSRSA